MVSGYVTATASTEPRAPLTASTAASEMGILCSRQNRLLCVNTHDKGRIRPGRTRLETSVYAALIWDKLLCVRGCTVLWKQPKLVWERVHTNRDLFGARAKVAGHAMASMDNPATQNNSAVDEAAQQPSDASNIRALLSSMGAEDYEPRVVNQLLDFMYKYVTDTLLDAEVSWCSQVCMMHRCMTSGRQDGCVHGMAACWLGLSEVHKQQLQNGESATA